MNGCGKLASTGIQKCSDGVNLRRSPTSLDLHIQAVKQSTTITAIKFNNVSRILKEKYYRIRYS